MRGGEKMMKKTIGILSILLLMTGVASAAFAELAIDPNTQNINVGETGIYTITLNTSDTGSGMLQWSTSSPLILARIGTTGSFAEGGSLSFDNTPSVDQTFTLEVEPQSDITLNSMYEVEVDYKGGPMRKIRAIVTGEIVPVPEIATVGLVSAGLVGMVLLRRRKD